ncbi:uncharacterized protein LOC141721504 isoform X2 [Apium graveolens]|uniref:uncharacterized protein LOC141721504 isoform X2 n=1 Tax=Apium graveolens TaxID=4045 RepID=UPI003D78C687
MEQGHASSSTPSVSSSSVGMVSSKCVESVSKGSDLDCIIVTQEDNLVAKNDQGQEQPAKRKKPLKSEVWNHFDLIEIDTKGNQSEKFQRMVRLLVGILHGIWTSKISRPANLV